MLDEIDHKILDILSLDSRKPIATIADILSMSRVTIRKRLERMERLDIISGYTLRFGSGYTHHSVQAHILVKSDGTACEVIAAKLEGYSDVKRLSSISGQYDAIIEIETATTADLDLLVSHIRSLKEVIETQTHILLSHKLDRRRILSETD